MQRVEQVKMLSATTEEALEELYNKWFIDIVTAREKVSLTRGQPLKVFDRRLTARVSGKTRIIFLAVFYEHIILEDTAQGPDRGKHLDNTGVSAVGPRRR